MARILLQQHAALRRDAHLIARQDVDARSEPRNAAQRARLLAQHVPRLDGGAQLFDQFGPESGYALFELFFWMFDKQRATAVDAASVTCPVLVVAGSADKVISAVTARKVAALYAHATFEEAEGRGRAVERLVYERALDVVRSVFCCLLLSCLVSAAQLQSPNPRA